MKKVKTGKIALLSLMIFALTAAPFANSHTVTATSGTQSPPLPSSELKYDSHLQETAEAGYFVLRSDGAQAVCHDALPEEIQLYNRRDPSQELHILNADPRSQIQPQATDGLTIILRGTEQLEANAAAKAAFVQAANTWQSLIKSPISIVIDIDFGTKRFGESYPQGVIGATRSQSVGNASIYADTRQRLINSAKSQEESNIYNALPQGTVPTELGSTSGISAPSSVFRSLGLL